MWLRISSKPLLMPARVFGSLFAGGQNPGCEPYPKCNLERSAKSWSRQILSKTMKMLYQRYWTWATEPRTGGKIIMVGPCHRTPNIKINYGGASKNPGAIFLKKSACGNVPTSSCKNKGVIFLKKKRLRQRTHKLRASNNEGKFLKICFTHETIEANS